MTNSISNEKAINISQEPTNIGVSSIKKFIQFNNQLGFYNCIYGIDYQRCLEYPVAFNQLALNSEITSLLDIGTGKHSIFPLYVSYRYPGITVRLTDWGNYVYKQLKRINNHKILKKQLYNSKIVIEKQDATNLTYENDSFDRVSAISVIEHIPEDGDTLSVKEMYRVLKPNGRMVITVPYKFNDYEAKYRQRTTYFNKYKGEPIFFSHYYNDEALEKRLLQVVNGEIESILYLVETEFPYFDFWCNKVPLRNTIKYFIGWINQLFALKYYKILNHEDRSKAHVAVITIIKR